MSINIAQCRTILDEVAARFSRDTVLPVRLRPICRQLGVASIRRAKLQSGSALLVDAGTKPKILVKAPDDDPRKQNRTFNWWERFVIAHELGHLVLEKHKMPFPAGRAEYWQVETLCDDFAARLLIPEHAARGVLRHDPQTPAQWLTLSSMLARRAEVPWLTAAFRLAEINKALAFLRIATREDGVLRVTSTRIGNRGFRRTIKPDSDLYRFLNKLKPGNRVSNIPSDLLSGVGSEATSQAIVAGAVRMFDDEYRIVVFIEN
jgi:IrrE N-terminal-like domain